MQNPQSTRKKRVGIVGGGPAGLACLRVFLQTPDLWDVTAFEGKASVGGVWYRGSTSRREGAEPPSSAIYDSLTTNIPHCIMSYHDYPFPPSTFLFPPASTVLQYLIDYATHFDLHQHVRLNSRVEECRWDGKQWIFKVRSSSGEKPIEELSFDVAILANGHYNLPFRPRIPGLESWTDDRVIHSAWYREPSSMAGRSVLVVGGGPSGRDIGREISGVAKHTYHSVRGSERDDAGGATLAKRSGFVGFQTTPEAQTGTALYEDGTKDDDIERVVLATGYEFDLPMLPPPHVINEKPPQGIEFPGSLYNSRSHLYPLARHLFPIQDHFPPTSIAFVGLPSRVIPFPLCEAQAAVVAKVFNDPASFDLAAEKRLILERRRLLLERAGTRGEAFIAKEWHRLPDNEQFEYRKELLIFAAVTEWKIAQWIVDAYAVKDILREEWRDVVRSGEAEKFVKGVTTEKDWAELIQRLLKRAEDRRGAMNQEQLSTTLANYYQPEAHDI